MHSYPFSLGASQRLHSIRIPAKAAMQVLATLLVFSLCLFPNLATAASPHIYDAPQAGPPGSQTSTVGNGWDPNATLDIYFDSTDVGLVDTDNNGSFGLALKAPTVRQNGLTIQIPKDAVPGQHWITAVERITQVQAQVAFTVGADWPQYQFGPDRTGFNPYENVLSPQTVGNLTTRWTTGGGTTPVVADGVLYEADHGSFSALNAKTGELLWSDPLSLDFLGIAPAVANGIVYFSCEDYYLYALNATTGDILWRYPEVLSTSPTVVNGVVYVATPGNNVDALDARTGALLWTKPGVGSWGGPAVANGVVYVGSGDSYLYALDAGTGATLWKSPGNPDYGIDSPLVANGKVYARSGSGELYAFNANTGAFLWKYSTGYGQNGNSSAVANGVVYVGGADYNVYALDAGTGALLWKYTTVGPVTTPTVANGVVYVGTVYQDHSVYALNASTGEFLWQYMTPDWVFSPPVVVNGMVYVASDVLYAFSLPDQQMAEKFSPPERPDPARLTPNWNSPLKK